MQTNMDAYKYRFNKTPIKTQLALDQHRYKHTSIQTNFTTYRHSCIQTLIQTNIDNTIRHIQTIRLTHGSEHGSKDLEQHHRRVSRLTNMQT